MTETLQLPGSAGQPPRLHLRLLRASSGVRRGPPGVPPGVPPGFPRASPGFRRGFRRGGCRGPRGGAPGRPLGACRGVPWDGFLASSRKRGRGPPRGLGRAPPGSRRGAFQNPGLPPGCSSGTANGLPPGSDALRRGHRPGAAPRGSRRGAAGRFFAPIWCTSAVGSAIA